MRRRSRALIIATTAIVWVAMAQLPSIGATALLYPYRRTVTAPPPDNCIEATFAGRDVELKGWRCRPTSAARGAVVYLHGIADNRVSGAGVVTRFVQRGYEAIAYDSRAHGNSGGTACTYGYFEKHDLRRVLDTIESRPLVLIGSSLGAAVALQTAAIDSRVSGVVAAESFSALRTTVRERAPFLFTDALIEAAFERAQQIAVFQVDDVSPLTAAAHIRVPVLLIHGDADDATPLLHSQRILEALAGPKQLIRVPGARHGYSLGHTWAQVDEWLDALVIKGSNPEG